MSIESMLLVGAILLLVSILSSKLSARLGIPSLLLFLLIGVLTGSEGPGGLYFDDPFQAQLLGVAALVFILFSGGLDTDWSNIQPVLWKGIILATAGVAITAIAMGWFATIVLGFSINEGLLLGSIVSSTDAAAVFALLRSRRISLRGDLRPLLELESGSNDPMAIFLTASFTGLLANPGISATSLVPAFAQQMVFGSVAGYLAGKGMVYAINRIKLEYDGLYPVLTISLVLMIYGITASLGGSGFLAVYLAGMVMGNRGFIHKRSLLRFHDGLAWLMQIAMFLTLGLLVFPSRLIPISGTSLLISVFLMIFARPLSVFALLLPFGIPRREKAMVAWVGLRGAVPIILATYPLLANLPQAELIFNVVFFIVITSVLVQGTSIPRVAKLLGVDAPLAAEPDYLAKCYLGGMIKDLLVEVTVPQGSPAAGKQIVDLGLNRDLMVVVLRRGTDLLMPSGKIVLQPEDVLLVLSNEASLKDLKSALGIKTEVG